MDYRPESIHVRAEIAKSLTGRLEEFWIDKPPPPEPKPKEPWEE